MPLEGQPLIIEPTYPRAAGLMEIGREKAEGPPPDIKIINRFWSWRHRCDIVIFEENGKRDWLKLRKVHAFDQIFGTLGASFAWGIEQESRAVQTLGTMVRHYQFKQYMLTGSFGETSPRSGLTYMFRRLRPTVVMTPHKSPTAMKILCCLCLHPIGYYEGTWAGAMCPTDDVIAHLMLMRGDEHMFWKRANQHEPYRPECGL